MSEVKQQNSNIKKVSNTLIIVILLITVAVMTYLWSSTRTQLSESNNEIEKLNADLKSLDDMISEYSGSVSSDMKSDLENMLETYKALKEEDPSQKSKIEEQESQIKALLDKVEKGKWTAAELAKMKRENETLRVIMKGYAKQIDSLNTLNLKLTSDLDKTRFELTSTTTERDNYKQSAEESAARVIEGSKLQAYGFSSGALRSKLNSTTTETDKAKNTIQFKSAFTIGANPITEKGVKPVYLQITKPDGTIYQSRTSNVISTGQGTVAYSDKKEIDYNGEAISLAIYYDLRGEEAQKGNYTVKIYCDGQMIGKDNFTLK
jgi:myosin heavy subunit